jgi:hypothetical protein
VGRHKIDGEAWLSDDQFKVKMFQEEEIHCLEAQLCG